MTPATFLTLFAQNAKRTEPFLQKAEDWVVVGLLIGTLFAAAGVFWLFERWRKKSLTAPTRDSAEELTNFRAMFERGEITEQEYNVLRQKVADRMKATPTPSATATSPTATPTPPAAPPPPPEQPPTPPGEANGPPPDHQAPPA